MERIYRMFDENEALEELMEVLKKMPKQHITMLMFKFLDIKLVKFQNKINFLWQMKKWQT